MKVISYPLTAETISGIFHLHDNKTLRNENINFKINEMPLVIKKDEGIYQVFDNLYQKGWIDNADNFENTDLYNLLNSLSEKSLPEVVLGFDGVLRHSFPVDHDTIFRFENNAQSGVSIHYSVVQKDKGCNLLKLNCEFLFGKDGSLINENPHISVEYFPQCPESLKDALDHRTVMRKVLDWIKNLFQLDIHISCDNEFLSNMEGNIIVKVSEGNEDNKIESMLENLSAMLKNPTEFEFNNPDLEWYDEFK